MQWIDVNALESWADRLNAREMMSALVADLIRATIEDATRFRFPSGEASQVRGWDGDLETTEAKGFVPAGKSKWEFGTGPGAPKATADYKKRTDQTSAEVMAENTLVLVNLGAWNTPNKKLTEWEAERREERKWKDVIYLDAVSLVKWLDDYPAVAARYARDVLKRAPQDGALSTDEYWEEFSTQFKPQLSEMVVVADRQKEADALVQKFLGEASSFMLGAETAEEVTAFAVAAIRTADPSIRKKLESKTLILRTENAARSLAMHSNMVFIVTDGASKLAGSLGKNCPTLSAAVGAQARRVEVLKRPSASAMADGFAVMGLDHLDGYELAHRCGRNLTILKRLIQNAPVPDPDWVDQTPTLKLALLAGGWMNSLQADCEILRQLSGQPSYAALESVLVATLSLSDRPFDREAEVWKVRSPVDAFYFYGSQLTDEDLSRLRTAIIEVFSKQPERPSPDEKFNQANVARTANSFWLRDGLALTLLIIASMHEVAGLHVKGRTPQQYVDELVNALPDWGKSHQSIIRLGNQAALFAEASPNPFLKALESMLEGDLDQIRPLFKDEPDSILAPASPHVDLLWGLETIAWDPRYLNRVVVVLAKLAQLDPTPDSKLVNRPINSLRDILLGWSPNTYAPQSQRITCLDLILQACPDVGWQLLKKLLPRYHGFASPTQHPKIRDFAPEVAEEITFGSVWTFETAVVDRAVVAAGDDETKLAVLVEAFGQMQPANRTKVLTRFDQYLSQFQTEEGCTIWHALKDEVANNSYFGDSEWALDSEELQEMMLIVERHRPADPLVSDRYVFDEWTPRVGKYRADEDEYTDPVTLRNEVLQNVYDREGIPGILRLSKMVKLPDLLGQAVSHITVPLEDMLELMSGSLEQSIPKTLALYVSAAGLEKFGLQWADAFKITILPLLMEDKSKAQMLLGWPANATTWAYVESLGEAIRDSYWSQVGALPIRGSHEDLLFAIEQFRRVGRDLDILNLLFKRVEDVPSEILMNILTQSIKQINAGDERFGNMLSYNIAETLKELRTRSDVEKLDIAKLVYAYLPLLRYENESLTVYEILANDPNMFVEVLSDVFRGKNASADQEITQEMKVRANVSYDLLSAFKTIPGSHEGLLNADALADWISTVRTLASAKDLSEIADQRIGFILAHAPQDGSENFWPPSTVCKMIEQFAAHHIERGFAIECFNKRGVYSKGANEGGGQERALAERYRSWADATVSFPRTSAMLMAISEDWERHAEREDTRAEIGKMKH